MTTTFFHLVNPGALPVSPTLILPNRLNVEEFHHLKELYQDRDLILLATEEMKLEESVLAEAEKSGLPAISFSTESENFLEVSAALKKRLSRKSLLLFLPPQVEAYSGLPSEVPTIVKKALCELGLDILPLAIMRQMEPDFSQKGKDREESTTLAYGELLKAEKLTLPKLIESNLAAGRKAYESREFLDGSLSVNLLKALKFHGHRFSVYDGVDDSELSYERVAAAALALANYLKQKTKSNRVGIILPPGKGGIMANLAVLFANKVPVNLNFTAGKAAVESAVEQAGLDLFITADRFMDKVPNFPWPENDKLIRLDQIAKELKPKVLLQLIRFKLFSAETLASQLGLNERRGEDEAVLLFTSGSSGTPKGVPLSHRNLLANVNQFGTRIEVPEEGALLGCLPLFHSIGATVTLLYPLMAGINLVTYPSPLETKRLAELIELKKAFLLCATPTFLRGYLRRAEPEQLKSLELVVTGAEKLPSKLAKAFEKRFNIRPLEGYGLTETAPVTQFNLPNKESKEGSVVIETQRTGSVGLTVPGVEVRITHPDTLETLSLDQQGLIWFRGANVFSGYLNLPEKNNEVFNPEGWFNTGDIGRLDEDGFLFLEGRLSRFSKIGGEMVPHEAIESVLNTHLGLDDSDERKIAVVGIPDEKKGESIVLLTSLSETKTNTDEFLKGVRDALAEAGLPALWNPKYVGYVSEIPMLASGKLDITTCQKEALKVGS